MDPRAEKRRLESAIPIDAEVKAQAEEIFGHAKRKLALHSSVFSSLLVGLCHVVFTKKVKTLAVKLTGDGNPMLMMNPTYLLRLGPDTTAQAENTMFILCHEAYHLLCCHIRPGVSRRDGNWTIATESWINMRVMALLNRKLPMVADKKGKEKPHGVDPEKIWDKYRAQLRLIGLEPVDKEMFFATDESIYSELCRMPKPIPVDPDSCIRASSPQARPSLRRPRTKNAKEREDTEDQEPKQRDTGSGDDPDDETGGTGSDDAGESTGDETGDETVELDSQQNDILVSKVLQEQMKAALNGNKEAKDELLDVEKLTPDCKTWGDLGLGALRGEPQRTRFTDKWLHWTMGQIGTRLIEGLRLRYNRKVWWTPRVVGRGDDEILHVLVAVDASGSMHTDVLTKIAECTGADPRISMIWKSFDATLWDYDSPGDAFRGGGGTSFQPISDYLDDADEEFDCVLVITDGFAPHIHPKEPDKWIWLIVPHGDTWPEAAGMSCRQIDPDEL